MRAEREMWTDVIKIIPFCIIAGKKDIQNRWYIIMQQVIRKKLSAQKKRKKVSSFRCSEIMHGFWIYFLSFMEVDIYTT